jgi:flagellar protein FliO/FliZ
MNRISLVQIITFVILGLGIGTVSAHAKSANRLTTVHYEGAEDRIEFSFTTKRPVTPDQVSARMDEQVLVISLAETRVKRHWLKLKDVDIKRALVHPARKTTAARLRIRFHDELDEAIVRNIRVRIEDGKLITSIPRSVEVAQFWEADAKKSAQTPVEPKKTAQTGAPEAQPKDKNASAKQGETVAQTTDFKAPKKAPVEKVAQEQPAADAKSLLNTKQLQLKQPAAQDAEAAVPVTNAVGQATNDGTRVGALAMAMLFLLGISAVLWRKMRNRSAPPGDGPMIRPVGTHMLGPKQGLLLVDVAGDMVLLGTSDKGVQMLTKIEGREPLDSDALNSRVTPSQHAVPQNAIQQAAKPAFAERFGRAISKIREAAQPAAESNASAYETMQRRIEAELTDRPDHLDALAGRVEDVGIGAGRRTMRREFSPVEPQRQAPVYAAQPPVVEADDLLNKLRNLQGA